VALVGDNPRVITITEQVTGAAVAAVEELRIDAVETLKARGEGLSVGGDDDVIVGAHQAERVAVPAMALDDVTEEPHEREPVHVVPEDGIPVDSSCGDVEETVR
jgi:hypothetical protein